MPDSKKGYLLEKDTIIIQRDLTELDLFTKEFLDEFEILYKEIILREKKDIEDAKHLRTFFSEIIKEKRFKEYESIIKEGVK